MCATLGAAPPTPFEPRRSRRDGTKAAGRGEGGAVAAAVGWCGSAAVRTWRGGVGGRQQRHWLLLLLLLLLVAVVVVVGLGLFRTRIAAGTGGCGGVG